MLGAPRSKNDIIGHRLVDGVPVPLSQVTTTNATAYDITPPPLRHGQIDAMLYGGEKAINFLGHCNAITGHLDRIEVVEFVSTLKADSLPNDRLDMNDSTEGYKQCEPSVRLSNPISQGFFPAAWDHIIEDSRILSCFPFAEDGWFQWACQEWVASGTDLVAQPAILTYRRGPEHGTAKTYMGGSWPTESSSETMPHRVVGFSQGRALLDTRRLFNANGEDITMRGAGGGIENPTLSNVSYVEGGLELWHIATQTKIADVWVQQAPTFRTDLFSNETPVSTEIGERVISASIWHNKAVIMTDQITNVFIAHPGPENVTDEITYRLYLYDIQAATLKEVTIEGLTSNKIYARYTSYGAEGPDDILPHLHSADTPAGLYYSGGVIGSAFPIQCLVLNANDGLLYIPLNYVTHEGVFTTGSIAGTPMTQTAIRLYAFGLIPNDAQQLSAQGYVTGPNGVSDNIGFFNSSHCFCTIAGT